MATINTGREEQIACHVRHIMDILKVPLDDSTKDTPGRVARMYCRELFKGLSDSAYPKVTTVENKFNYDQMIVVKGIKIHSMCEHHLVPFMGTAAIAYFPDEKVLGLSKFNRIADFWARRPQIQERLTMQIHGDLTKKLDTQDVAVLIQAEHLCVKLRGVQDQGTTTTTSMLTGRFRDKLEVKNEFLSLANKG